MEDESASRPDIDTERSEVSGHSRRRAKSGVTHQGDPPTQWPDDGRVQDLHPSVALGQSHPQTRILRACLTATGFGQLDDNEDYDETVASAVARFHEAQPRYKTYGVARDTAIKPEGFFALQRRAGRR